MVRELAAERPLDDRFLESTDGGLELLMRDRPLSDELVENLGRDRASGASDLSRFGLRCIDTPHAMPHTRNS